MWNLGAWLGGFVWHLSWGYNQMLTRTSVTWRLPGTGEANSKMVHSHTGKVLLTCWPEPQFLSMWNFLTLLTARWLNSSRGRNSRDLGKSCNAFDDLASEITHHHSYHILLVTRPALILCVRILQRATRKQELLEILLEAGYHRGLNYFCLSKLWFSSFLGADQHPMLPFFPDFPCVLYFL